MAEILLVMRKPGNIRVLSEALESQGHCCTGLTDCRGLADGLQSKKPDLVLMDVSGLGESAWTTCKTLQQREIPFIVISAKHEMAPASKTLSYGAASILEKPVVKDSLLHLVRNITDPV